MGSELPGNPCVGTASNFGGLDQVSGSKLEVPGSEQILEPAADLPGLASLPSEAGVDPCIGWNLRAGKAAYVKSGGIELEVVAQIELGVNLEFVTWAAAFRIRCGGKIQAVDGMQMGRKEAIA